LPPHHDLRVRHDVVAEVGVERCAHLGGAALDLGHEPEQRPAVVRLREALALHQAAALELGVREQEAVRRHELDPGGVVPAGEQLAQQARDARLADGHGAGDADHERRGLRALAEEVARDAMELLGAADVQVEQAAEREVDLLDLPEVQRVAEAAQLHDLGLLERKPGVLRQLGPVGTAQLHEGGAGLAVRRGSAASGAVLSHRRQV